MMVWLKLCRGCELRRRYTEKTSRFYALRVGQSFVSLDAYPVAAQSVKVTPAAFNLTSTKRVREFFKPPFPKRSATSQDNRQVSYWRTMAGVVADRLACRPPEPVSLAPPKVSALVAHATTLPGLTGVGRGYYKTVINMGPARECRPPARVGTDRSPVPRPQRNWNRFFDQGWLVQLRARLVEAIEPEPSVPRFWMRIHIKLELDQVADARVVAGRTLEAGRARASHPAVELKAALRRRDMPGCR